MANQVPNISLKFDVELELSEGQTSTVSEAGTRSATDQFVDLGADTTIDGFPTVYGQFEVTSSDFTTANETYVLTLQNSSDNTFASVDGPSATVSVIGSEFGRYVLALQPTRQFLRAFVTLGGTTPILVWRGFLGLQD